eukprot:365693-Chlamydomonas_euryale.AAC.2
MAVSKPKVLSTSEMSFCRQRQAVCVALFKAAMQVCALLHVSGDKSLTRFGVERVFTNHPDVFTDHPDVFTDHPDVFTDHPHACLPRTAH